MATMSREEYVRLVFARSGQEVLVCLPKEWVGLASHLGDAKSSAVVRLSNAYTDRFNTGHQSMLQEMTSV